MDCKPAFSVTPFGIIFKLFLKKGPTIKKWGLIFVGSVVMFIVGGSMLPKQTQNAEAEIITVSNLPSPSDIMSEEAKPVAPADVEAELSVDREDKILKNEQKQEITAGISAGSEASQFEITGISKENPDKSIDVKKSSATKPKREVLMVANRNSGIFHTPSCHLGDKIKPSNRRELKYDDAMNSGYRPCKVCHPSRPIFAYDDSESDADFPVYRKK